jgi:hypothetical protein
MPNCSWKAFVIAWHQSSWGVQSTVSFSGFAAGAFGSAGSGVDALGALAGGGAGVGGATGNAHADTIKDANVICTNRLLDMLSSFRLHISTLSLSCY